MKEMLYKKNSVSSLAGYNFYFWGKGSVVHAPECECYNIGSGTAEVLNCIHIQYFKESSIYDVVELK